MSTEAHALGLITNLESIIEGKYEAEMTWVALFVGIFCVAAIAWLARRVSGGRSERRPSTVDVRHASRRGTS